MGVSLESQVELLRGMLDASERAVAVTGAGISVSAGIASMEGMDLAATLQMMSETLLRAVPGRYYRGVWKGFLRGMYEAGPTPAHRALARLEADGVPVADDFYNGDAFRFALWRLPEHVVKLDFKVTPWPGGDAIFLDTAPVPALGEASVSRAVSLPQPR